MVGVVMTELPRRCRSPASPTMRSQPNVKGFEYWFHTHPDFQKALQGMMRVAMNDGARLPSLRARRWWGGWRENRHAGRLDLRGEDLFDVQGHVTGCGNPDLATRMRQQGNRPGQLWTGC
jgi:hypothetical protein